MYLYFVCCIVICLCENTKQLTKCNVCADKKIILLLISYVNSDIRLEKIQLFF